MTRRCRASSARCFALLLLSLLILSSLLSFSAAALVEHSSALGLDALGSSASVAALGDFNNDKHCDLVVLTQGTDAVSAKKTYTLALWMWHPNPGQFLVSPSASSSLSVGASVANVVALDFDWDGRLDLLVSGPGVDAWLRPVTWMALYLGNGEGGFLPAPIMVPPSAGRGGVHVLDANNDLRPDLFGERYVIDALGAKPSGTLGDTARSYWISRPGLDARVEYVLQPQQLDRAPLSPSSAFPAPLPILSTPSSHASVDLDGDCMADLVVTSSAMVSGAQRKFVEIWLNDAQRGPVFHSRSILPLGAGQIHFADVDNDGNIDFVLPVFDSAGAGDRIEVYYNVQKGVCGSSFASTQEGQCRPPSALCVADDQFGFDFMNFTETISTPPKESPSYAAYVFPASKTPGARMFDPSAIGGADASSIVSTPFQLRTGDINLDGFPDVLLALTPAATTSAAASVEYGVAQLWENVPCVASAAASPTLPSVVCSEAAQASGRRIFSGEGLDASNAVLGAISGAYAGASFFDVSDDGEVDILFSAIQPVSRGSVAGTPPPVPAGAHTTHVFVNNEQHDAYFLTVLASNGVCPAWCPTEPRFPSPKPYGTPALGGTVKFSYTDLGGDKHASIGTQVSQSGALSLTPPYCTFGLGRTNTFIDTFFFGVGLNQTRHSRAWLSMVPNSQVILFPFPPDEPDEWTLELFVAPSSQLLGVCISWAATLAALALVIAYLHFKEKREDEQEKRKHQLLFTF